MRQNVFEWWHSGAPRSGVKTLHRAALKSLHEVSLFPLLVLRQVQSQWLSPPEKPSGSERPDHVHALARLWVQILPKGKVGRLEVGEGETMRQESSRWRVRPEAGGQVSDQQGARMDRPLSAQVNPAPVSAIWISEVAGLSQRALPAAQLHDRHWRARPCPSAPSNDWSEGNLLCTA